MFLEESYGIVMNDNKWDDLCSLIVDYIYDIQGGLNSNPFMDNSDEVIIKKNHIISYYKYKYNTQKINELIPNWIYDFKIILLTEHSTAGSFKKSEATLVNDKLNFTIIIKDGVGKTPNEFNDTLIHEFRHAYTQWLELTKNFQVYSTNNSKLLYNAIISKLKELPNINIVKQINIDSVVLNENIYSDKPAFQNAIIKSLYYTRPDEITSFLQEFANQIKYKISLKEYDIKKSIYDSNELKKKYNTLNNEDKWKSNILNNIDISGYSSKIYSQYQGLLLFWKYIEKTNEELLDESLSDLRKIIKLYLNIPISKSIDSKYIDVIDVYKDIAQQQQNIIKKVLTKMNKIFAMLILNITTDKPNADIQKEIDDTTFENEIMRILN